MWGFYSNPMLPLFNGARAAASNVPAPGESGDYTLAMFQTDHPEFFSGADPPAPLLPENMLQIFINQANTSVLPSRWSDMWELAAGLYVAHFAALYLKTYSTGQPSAGQTVTAATPTGLVSSAKMGDTSLNFDNTAITEGTKEWGAWNSTVYGQQLITYARLIGMGGMYVI